MPTQDTFCPITQAWGFHCPITCMALLYQYSNQAVCKKLQKIYCYNGCPPQKLKRLKLLQKFHAPDTKHTNCPIQHNCDCSIESFSTSENSKFFLQLTGASKLTEERQLEPAVCATLKSYIAAFKMDSVRELRPSPRNEKVEWLLPPVVQASEKMYL